MATRTIQCRRHFGTGWTRTHGAVTIRAMSADFHIDKLSALFLSSSYTAGYDGLDRVNSLTQSSGTSSWTYDADSNRLTQSGSSVVAFTPSSSSNRLSSTSGALVRTYGYDAAGNTSSYTGASFLFNQRGRMHSATTSGGTTSYIYNALGELIEKSGAGGTTLLMYDESGHLFGEYSSTGALIQETVWMGEIPVATLRPNGSTVSIYYVHTDHLNAPRVITQSSDNSVRWLWGGNAANQNPLNLGTFAYNLRYPGQYFQAETGLSYNYFRDYDPATGRYLESDPIGLNGGINTYVYAGENPISNYDPRGTDCIKVGIKLDCVNPEPGGPAFSLPVPDDFPTVLSSLWSPFYHSYEVHRPMGCADPSDVLERTVDSPTFANSSPASAGGTPNNADVIPGWNNLVTSYITNDVNTGDIIVVNLTGRGSAFGPGYVARTVSKATGLAHTYGEGASPYQDPLLTSPLGQWLLNEMVWGSQMSGIIAKAKASTCGCQ